MEFSVLMSVYKNDNAEYLKKALESIYDNQSVKPAQIVIVIDGVIGDELHNVIESFYRDNEDIVTIVPLEQNVGLGVALNEGMKYCKYDWIARMDSDDISCADRFKVQIEYIKNHNNVDVVGGNIAEFNIDINEDMRKRVVPDNHEEILQMAKTRNSMNHVTVMMKKSSVINSGGYKPLALAEDYYLWIRMLNDNCVFGNINQVLVYVRVGNGFMNRRADHRIVKSWMILQKFMIQNKLTTKAIAAFNMIKVCGFMYCPGFVKRIAYGSFLRK